MKVTKTDKRHNGYRIMKYIVEPSLSVAYGRDGRIALFKQWREWLWEAYGPGCELDFVVLTPVDAGLAGQCQMAAQERWAWHTENNQLRIYLIGDAELSGMMLQWD